MNIEHIKAQIRIRNPWEAIDLGFALIQNWWPSFYMQWAALTIALSTLIFLALPEGYKATAPLIVWWLKPLLDRILLFIFSHRLFNDQLATTQILDKLPWMLTKTGLFSALTWRRFSLSRGFVLPIWQLEQVTGKQIKARKSALFVASHNHAVILTHSMLAIETIVFYASVGLVYMLVPEQNNLSISEVIDFVVLNQSDLYWVNVASLALYTLVVIVIEPFYIAASFTLYLNRRTQLEAWDIELHFRQLAKRLEENQTTKAPMTRLNGLFLAALLVIPLSLSYSPNSYADVSDTVAEQRLPASEAKPITEKIMQQENLQLQREIKTWVPKGQRKKPETKKRSEWMQSLVDFLITIRNIIGWLFESLLWLIVAAAIYLLYRYRDTWLPFLMATDKEKAPSYTPPDVLFGMDVAPASLPDDIAHQAQKLYQAGDYRAALSLLYRGSLAHLINHENLEIHDSHTEGDILTLSKAHLKADKQSLFSQLTSQWQQVAYAHQAPQQERVLTLLKQWPEYFAALEAKNTPQEQP